MDNVLDNGYTDEPMMPTNHLPRWARPGLLLVAAILLTIVVLAGCGGGDPTLTVYSSRFDTLVGPLVYRFSQESGIDVQVKYASTVETTARIMEEGEDTPADVVYLSDPSYLGGLSKAGSLLPLSETLLNKVDPRFRSSDGDWVGTSGRARTVVYNTAAIDPERDLPGSIAGFTAPKWNGRVGWTPGDDSFHEFLTAFRMHSGDNAARRWLAAMKANNTRNYPDNTTTVLAIARGEVDVGFSTHFYVQRYLQTEGPEFGARNHFLGGSDLGSLVLVAGAAILSSSANADLGQQFIEYLLSEPIQRYVASTTTEYPLVAGVAPEGDLPPLESLDPPDVDLGDLTDLQGSRELLWELDILPVP